MRHYDWLMWMAFDWMGTSLPTVLHHGPCVVLSSLLPSLSLQCDVFRYSSWTRVSYDIFNIYRRDKATVRLQRRHNIHCGSFCYELLCFSRFILWNVWTNGKSNKSYTGRIQMAGHVGYLTRVLHTSCNNIPDGSTRQETENLFRWPKKDKRFNSYSVRFSEIFNWVRLYLFQVVLRSVWFDAKFFWACVLQYY